MSRVVFISDIDTPLGEELARLYLQDDNRVFATASPVEKKKQPGSYTSLMDRAGESLRVETWNRNSPISAKNMILRTLSRYNGLDEVLLLGNADLSTPALHDSSYETIERTVDCWVKGNLFLLKPVLTRYLEKKEGTLALICMKYDDHAGPMPELIRRSFLGLTHSLLDTYGNKGFSINAFESTSTDIEEFAAYIFRNLTDKGAKTSGKWRRYRGNILSGLKVGPRSQEDK